MVAMTDVKKNTFPSLLVNNNVTVFNTLKAIFIEVCSYDLTQGGKTSRAFVISLKLCISAATEVIL